MRHTAPKPAPALEHREYQCFFGRLKVLRKGFPTRYQRLPYPLPKASLPATIYVFLPVRSMAYAL